MGDCRPLSRQKSDLSTRKTDLSNRGSHRCRISQARARVNYYILLSLHSTSSQVKGFTNLSAHFAPGAMRSDSTEHIPARPGFSMPLGHGGERQFFGCRKWHPKPPLFNPRHHTAARNSYTFPWEFLRSHAPFCSDLPLRPDFVRARPACPRAVFRSALRKPRRRSATGSHAQPPRRPRAHWRR